MRSLRPIQLIALLVPLACLMALTAHGTPASAVGQSAPAATPTPVIGLTQLSGTVSRPVDITHAGDSRLFVVEKAGRIRIYQADTLVTTPFLDITDRVNDTENEEGLLGLTFHPNYAANGYFYVNYTTDAPLRTRISRFSVTANPDVANPNSELILLEYSQPFINHNGGALHFGNDGYLYIASGDGGSGGDPNNNAQNLSVLLGKILRIDVDHTGATGGCDISGISPKNYAIPPGNPFADGAGSQCDEIWALGLRNPWRFSFDRLTQDIWIGDVGQDANEEVDFQVAGDTVGRNYGWRCYEGNAAYNTSGCGPAANYVFPVYSYAQGATNCAVTGGYVYRGASFLGLDGHYLFSDYCSAKLWTLSDNPTTPTFTTWALAAGSSLSNPNSFGENASGELFIASNSGKIFRLTDASAAPMTPISSVAISGGNVSLTWTTHANNCSYEVHQAANPYFRPGYATRLITLGDASNSYPVPGVIGLPAEAQYYLIRALNCSLMSGADSNRVGVFEYELAKP